MSSSGAAPLKTIIVSHVAALGSREPFTDHPLQCVSVLGNALAFITNNVAFFAPATSATLNPLTELYPVAPPSDSLPSASNARQQPASSSTPPRTLTALALASFGRNTQDMVILVGDDAGFLHLLNPQLQLCLSQRLWKERVQQIRVVTADVGSPPGDDLLPQAECFTVAFPNAVCRIPAFEVLAALKTFKAAQGRAGAGTPRLSDHRLVVDLWDLDALQLQPRTDALCLGPCPFSASSLLHNPSGEGELLVTVGEGVCLAGAVGEVARASSGSFLVKVAQGAVQGVLGALSKAPLPSSSWLFSRLRGESEAGAGDASRPQQGQGTARERSGRGLSLLAALGGGGEGGSREDEELRQALEENPPKACSMLYGIDDPPRSIRRITVAAGRWSRTGALLDNLGRVLIVDLASGHVLHVLKGYRDAQVAWLGGSSPSEPLHLVITIPKSRQIEAWRYEGSGAMTLAAALEEGTERFPRAPEVQLVAPTSPFGCFGLNGSVHGSQAQNLPKAQSLQSASSLKAQGGNWGPAGSGSQLQRLPSGQNLNLRDAMPLIVYKNGMDGMVHVARVEL